MFVITDMHAHLSCIQELEEGKITRRQALRFGAEELEFRRKHHIRTFVSTGRPWEWELLREVLQIIEGAAPEPGTAGRPEESSGRKPEGDCVRVSFGIHPWYADQFCPEEQSDAFRACDALGEIGMDSVWCNVPLSVQRMRLERQLQIAADLQKPVILHTKGCETDIADILRGFPGKILIHWFSGTYAQLEKFLELDCYFTLGPDLAAACGLYNKAENGSFPDRQQGRNAESGSEIRLPSDLWTDCTSPRAEKARLYQAMLCEIPESRLFLETDGRSAVEWALDRPVSEKEIPDILSANLRLAAWAKGRSEAELAGILEDNFRRFSGTGCG